MPACSCDWSDFVKWIIPFLSSPESDFVRPPASLIESYARKTAYDFLFRSGVLRRKRCFDLVCGVKDYPLSPQHEDATVYHNVTVCNQPLKEYQYEVVDDILYLEDSPMTDVREGLCIEYSYVPCLTEKCEVPQILCSRYREVVIDGTLAQLFSMPKMGWYSMGEANRRTEAFEDGISRAMLDMARRKSSRRKTIYDIKTRFIQ